MLYGTLVHTSTPDAMIKRYIYCTTQNEHKPTKYGIRHTAVPHTTYAETFFKINSQKVSSRYLLVTTQRTIEWMNEWNCVEEEQELEKEKECQTPTYAIHTENGDFSLIYELSVYIQYNIMYPCATHIRCVLCMHMRVRVCLQFYD